MQSNDKRKSPFLYSQFVKQLELSNGKGIPINQIPCTYAIAHQSRCLIFGFVTLCPVKCPKFAFGEPVDEANEFINTWCKYLEKIDSEYFCSINGQLSEQKNCNNCPIHLGDQIELSEPTSSSIKRNIWQKVLNKIRR